MNKENDNEEIVNSTNVPLDLIVQNKNQPRKDFDNESIEELKQSLDWLASMINLRFW